MNMFIIRKVYLHNVIDSYIEIKNPSIGIVNFDL